MCDTLYSQSTMFTTGYPNKYEQHQSVQQTMKSLTVSTPECIDTDNNNKGEQSLFSFKVNDTNFKYIDANYLNASPLYSPSPSPMNSMSNQYIHDDRDDNYLPTDNDERDDHPSLQPKYTNDTAASSNFSNISVATSAYNTSATHSQFVVNGSVHYTKDNLPAIRVKKTGVTLSSKLIYENMDKFKTYQSAQSDINEDAFLMVDDDEDDEEEVFELELDENEQYPFDYRYGSDADDIDADIDNDLFIDNPPSLQLSVDSMTSSDNDEIIEYDEDGDHDMNIPNEFRNLSLHFTADATPEPLGPFDGCYDDNFIESLSSTHSEDEDDIESEFEPETVTITRPSLTKCDKMKSKRRRRYTPPKHISQRIALHNELKMNTKSKIKAAEKNTMKQYHPKITNSIKPELNAKHFEMFNLQTPMDDTEENQFDFNPTNFSLQLQGFGDDDDMFTSHQPTTSQKKFDFSVPPHRVRLSEAACQHLVDLCEYGTDDDM